MQRGSRDYTGQDDEHFLGAAIMKSNIRTAMGLVLTLGVVGSAALPLQAQTSVSRAPQSVISANPFGVLFGLFNAEYERVVSKSATAGFGGSTFPSGGDNYINADVFWRFYPEGTPLEGWAFGAKAGVTRFSANSDVDGTKETSTFFGAGFDVNRSWIMGPSENFYVGIGFGLKRIYVGNSETLSLKFVPTFRIVNIGIAF